MAKEPYLYGKRALWRETEACARVKRVLFAWQKRPIIRQKRPTDMLAYLRNAHVSKKTQ